MGAGGALSTRVLIYGLWHLGSVTAACLAEHFNTVGYDPDDETVSKLRSGQPPVFEPGLAELIQVGLSTGGLSFTDNLATAAQAADVIWVTFDTPVGDIPPTVQRSTRAYPACRHSRALGAARSFRCQTSPDDDRRNIQSARVRCPCRI